MSHKDPVARAAYFKQWYADNREQEVARIKKNQRALRKLIRDAKDKPCADCGRPHPYYVMQFDHVRGEKESTLNKMHMRFGRQQILKEIAKCDVVCANCHAERTWQRAHK